MASFKKNFAYKSSKRIFAIVLSVFIFVLSVGNSFYSTRSISRVFAAEIAAGVTADAAWKLILAFLAELGLGTAIASNWDAVKENVMDTYTKQAEAEVEMGRFLVEGTADAVMNIYDSVTDTVRSIPWSEYIDALKGVHDSAVDTLTGIYARYAPELIGFTRDFAYGLATGDIIVEGVNDDVFLDSKVIDSQWSGEPFSYEAYFSYVKDDGVYTYNILGSHTRPVVGYFDSCYSSNLEFSLHFYQLNPYFTTFSMGSAYSFVSNGKYSWVTNKSDTLSPHAYYSCINVSSVSYSANFPVFATAEEAKAYLMGEGDVTAALNWGGVIDNDDLPLWGVAHTLSDAISRAPDVGGVGSIGAGSLVDDLADDIPYVGLNDLQDYIDAVQDVVDGISDGVIDGTFDLPLDIPDAISTPYTDAWGDVIDNSIPFGDVKNPTKDKPVEGDNDKPVEGDIPDVVDDVIDIPLVVPDLSGDFSGISDMLKTKFPFSLPWDLHYLLTGLASTPKTPVYELPLVVERLGINETITIDMSDFEDISRLSRAMLSLIWAYALINWTVKIVSVRKED